MTRVAFDSTQSRIGGNIEFAKEVAQAIAAVVKLNAVIVDDQLFKIADSDHLDDPVIQISRFTLAGHALRTRSNVIVKNAVENELCARCPSRSVCRDKAQIVVPIWIDDEIVGTFVLNGKTEEQRSRMIENIDDFVVYLQKMSGLLANRIIAEETNRQVKHLEQQLHRVIDEIDYGLIYLDPDNRIILFNDVSQRFLDRKLKSGEGITLALPEYPEAADNRDGTLVARSGDTLSVMVKSLGDHGSLIEISRASNIQKQEQAIRRRLMSKAHSADATFSNIIGNSPSILRAVRTAQKYATVDATVLLSAETGTGKELFAQSIHNASSRKDGPFVAINCAALPENLLESELFGYVKGAFTGARTQGKAGLFEQAHGGTIFLDEISEMPLRLQSGLLRVLQQKEVMRIGDDRVLPIDVRVISATNKNLEELVATNGFRTDLFYRLNILLLNLPPLRERVGDIPELVRHLYKRYSKSFGTHPLQLDDSAVEVFMGYEWPGNVRELQNAVQRMVLLAENQSVSGEMAGMVIQATDTRAGTGRHEGHTFTLRLSSDFKDIQRQMIEQLMETESDKLKIAHMLGLSHMTVYRRLGETRNNN